MTYVPDAKRYDGAQFRRCGRSGIVLPPVSLGLWQNFGGADVFETGRAVIRRAFDRGVTHFDLANNYGPPYGSAEENFGQILRKDFRNLQEFYRKYENPFEPYIRRLYGKYLKANEQPQGLMSYNEVIAWLVAYYKKYGRDAV